MSKAIRSLAVIGLFTLGVLAVNATPARAELIHRYSFKDGKADDSVGKINGKLVGGAKVVDNKLVLKNTGKVGSDDGLSYVSFSERLLPKSGSATVEVWFTSKCDGSYARVLDFGQRGQGYLFLTVDQGNDQARTAITRADWGEETSITSDDSVNDQKQHMVALVIDGKASTYQLIIDGKKVGSPEPLDENSLEKVKGTNQYLGKSQFDTDAGFTGSIEELRIFDTALTADQVRDHFKAGPAELEAKKSASEEKKK
jgi:hypothetical protein